MTTRLRRLYGAGGVHLLVMLACLALAACAITRLGVDALWNPDPWWQSIAVWFLGAVIAHDLVLFPVYALLDRIAVGSLRERRRPPGAPGVSAVNFVRVPCLAVGLLLLLFFPGIIEQGSGAYQRATGQTQEPFLQRWLLLSAGIFAFSGLLYAVKRWIRP